MTVRLDDLVRELDAYFRVPEVRHDDWAPVYEMLYPDPYWRDYAEPDYEGRWNGLLVRGSDTVRRAVTCVFPSDRIVAGLAPDGGKPALRTAVTGWLWLIDGACLDWIEHRDFERGELAGMLLGTLLGALSAAGAEPLAGALQGSS